MQTTPDGTSSPGVSESEKQVLLEALRKEHATTMKVLRAYPADQLDLRPAENCRTARELGWVFVMERGLGEAVFNDRFAELAESGETPSPPDSWGELLGAVEAAHRSYEEMIRATPAEQLSRKVHFFTAPQTIGEIGRMEWLWFLLHDEIHHRGQFSIYLRMAGGKVPSIYGPSADEPWM